MSMQTVPDLLHQFWKLRARASLFVKQFGHPRRPTIRLFLDHHPARGGRNQKTRPISDASTGSAQVFGILIADCPASVLRYPKCAIRNWQRTWAKASKKSSQKTKLPPNSSPEGPLLVYPGSFDPPTIAHREMLLLALKAIRGSHGLVLLDLVNVDKRRHTAPLADRLALAAVELGSISRASVGLSSHGLYLDKVRALRRARLAGDRSWFMVGSDTMARIIDRRYYTRPERDLGELAGEAGFLVYPRRATPVDELPIPKGFVWRRLDWRGRSPLGAVSSTRARRLLGAGQKPSRDLSPTVHFMARQGRLYGARMCPMWVVTIFLRRKGKVLVVKRGRKVSTYRGQWSAVTGFLDWPAKRLEEYLSGRLEQSLRVAMARSQALQELREETAIERNQLSFVREGRPLTIEDEQNERLWSIVPFLFDLETGVEPVLDWENVAIDWLWPHELHELPTVPGLAKVLERLLGRELREGTRRLAERELERLAEDRCSGASEIATGCLDAMQGWAGSVLGGRAASPLRLKRAMGKLVRCQPMAPLLYIRESLFELLSRKRLGPRAGFGKEVQRVRAQLRSGEQRVVYKAKQLLRKARRVATYSYSSTAARVLEALGAPVTICRDREGHGARLAARLRGAGLKVRLQGSRGRIAAEGLLLGCDAHFPDGGFINARGTGLVVQRACQAGLPVYVLAPQAKRLERLPRGWSALEEKGFERIPSQQGVVLVR